MLVLSKYSVAVFDIDGVLCRPGQQIEPKVISAIKYLREQGIKDLYNSGKNTWYITGGLRFSGLLNKDMIVIGENGGEIYYPNTHKSIIYDKYLDDVKSLRQEFYHRYLELRKDGFFYDDNTYSGFVWEEPKKSIFTVFPRDVERLPTQVLKEIFDEMIEEKSLSLYSLCHSDTSEVVQIGMNKGSALKVLKDKGEIDLVKTIGFGDGSNDHEMLDLVGLPIAVSNANEKIKELVRKKNGYITQEPYGNGVLEAFEKIISGEVG